MATKTGEPLSASVQALMDLEERYAAGTFGSTPGFIVSGKITLTNFATHSAEWPKVAKTLCDKFGYDKVSPMVTGAEAADAACKFARKWAIKTKGVAPEDALVLGCSDNYHGVTAGIWSIMEPYAQRDYGVVSKNLTNLNPRTGRVLRYGHVEDFEEVLEEFHGRVAGIIMECIHGHLPSFEEEIQFAISVRQLCKKYNVLFIADENKPDMVTMGKSITAGAYPASYILGNNEVMTLINPYESGSTFGMAAAANAATLAALRVYDEEKLLDRATAIGDKWAKITSSWKHPFIKHITNRGADACIYIKPECGSVTGRRICRLAFQRGVFIYPHGERIRVGMALTITDEEFDKGMRILKSVLDDIESYGEMPGSIHEAETPRV
ncbi:pyridoxal phosphate-dependent transferase [Diaporthe sp. PMI_573]|nr:pyridoxal phosphate-dependent transferase [Diaporthaceae sp. PMI_573]